MDTAKTRFEIPEGVSEDCEALAARLEPFDSYWQAPRDVEKGFRSFRTYYRANFLPHLPKDRAAKMLVVSCGPGYLLQLLRDEGYTAVHGIDSDPEKLRPSQARGLSCEVANAFPFVAAREAQYDAIICEQELNHLTLDEMIRFFRLCHRALRPGGTYLAYGLNGSNPIVGAENLAHNIDHFHTFTEYSLKQSLELGGFYEIRVLPLKLYVFWTNPLNYVGLAVTGALHLCFRVLFKMYGKDAKIFTKKIAAACRKP